MLYGGLADDSVDEISGEFTKTQLSVLAKRFSYVPYVTEGDNEQKPGRRPKYLA